MQQILAFGQPLGGVVQMAYTVPDLDAAVRYWTDVMRVGPFFLLDSSMIEDAHYRGSPTHVQLRAGLAWSGTMCIELIEQTNAAPSVYAELIAAHGHGFHHVALATRDIDADIARFEAQGAPAAFTGRVIVGDRFAYMDTTAALGAMVELIATNDKVEQLFAHMKQAAERWDGRERVASA